MSRFFLTKKPQFHPIFDALIIDEGQDLVTGNDNLKFIVDDEKKRSYLLVSLSVFKIR